MTELASLLAALDEGERVRGRGFEKLCRWVLETAPEYAAKIEKVWLWDEWPGGSGSRDAGIDLVVRDRDGGLWAVQAKHYNPAYALKKADVDSFLSESSRREFTYRLLIATTDHLGPTARRTLGRQEKPVGTLLRSDLEAFDLLWPKSLDSLRPVKPKPKKARPHQRQAVRAIIEGLKATDRGQVVMACGTGKTLVARFLHDTTKSRRTLVLVPSLSLLKQSLREWLAVGSFDYLAVCSDETVAPDDADAVVSATSELGVPVTTDPAVIAAFLRKRDERVVFATYQSSPRIAQAQTGRVPGFDLVVADEAHRCAGPQAGVFATVLDPARIKARKRVFMTATPRYFTGRVQREAREADWEVASMDDEAKFGPVLHRLSFAQAIQRDLLSDYQVVVVGVTDDSYRDLAECGAFVTTDGETVTDARTLARQIGLLRAMRNYDLHRVVSFHSRISSASRFARDVLDVAAWMPRSRRPTGRLWAEHVSGRMTSGEREAKLNRLRAVGDGERGLLSNARCLSEGVDVPTLDGVAFIDPRRSQVDVVQAVGRAIRKAEEKTVGTIVIPVLVDATVEPEQALEASEFDRVWQVVRALRDHDDDLADELDALRRGLGERGTLRECPGKIVLDLPIGVTADFAVAFDTRVVEVSTSSWEYGLGAARAYWDKHGGLRVPWDHITEHGFRLGHWISYRRADREAGQLSQVQERALNELGMVWSPFDEDWALGLKAARTFREANGHLLIPAAFRTERGYPLGAWISRRRGERREKRLDAERIAALDALGMVWDAMEETWQQGFRAARDFREKHGNLRVPQRHITESGFRLGGWLSDRRVRPTERLSPERISALDALDMIWDVHEEDWQAGVASAKAFRSEHGHFRVPRTYVSTAGFPLGNWLAVRRTQRRKGRIVAGRIAQLDALGMVWEPDKDRFERGLEECRGFRETEGNLLVPLEFKTSTGFHLGEWINTRRVERRRRTLGVDRIAALDDLGMIWNPAEIKWQRGVEAARHFRGEHGHLRVPRSYVTAKGFHLGHWIDSRRAEYRRGTLVPERASELDALGMVWNTLNKT